MKTGKYFLLILCLALFGLSAWGTAHAAGNPATANSQALVPWERITDEKLIPKIQPLVPVPINLVASADRQHIAYVVGVNNQFRVISNTVDGEAVAGEAFDAVFELRFSPDSRRLAYVAREGNGFRVVVDGEKERLYDNVLVGSLRFSPDSHHVAYIAKRGTELKVVADGQTIGSYGEVTAESLQFSPDSQGLIYVAGDGSQEFVVANGFVGKRYDAIFVDKQYDAIYEVTPIKEGNGTEATFGVRYMAVSGGRVFSVEERLK